LRVSPLLFYFFGPFRSSLMVVLGRCEPILNCGGLWENREACRPKGGGLGALTWSPLHVLAWTINGNQ